MITYSTNAHGHYSFSEDIDLIFDWPVLGYATSEPWAERSKTSQDKLNKEMDNRTCNFLRDVFLPTLKDEFAQLLSEPFKLFINDDEPQTVCFAYPRIFNDGAIVSVVRMEIGALSAWTPTQTATIHMQRYITLKCLKLRPPVS